MRARSTIGLLAALSVTAGVIACGSSSKNNEQPPPAPSAAPTIRSSETPAPDAVKDAGAHAANAKDAAPEPYNGPMIGALFLQTPVMSEMEWPKEDADKKKGSGSVRLGYIRQGSRVPVIAEAHVKPNCKEGWYELLQGGFVCGKYASLDANHPRIKTAPHPPYTNGALPYDYGYNVANGTPLYRTIPSHEERMAIEPWLSPKPKKHHDDSSASNDDLDAGAGGIAIGSALTLTKSTTTLAATDPNGDPADAGVPWYLRDYDGGKPQVTLDDLRGDGPVSRRMVKGFFLALDHDFSSNGGRWWKTTGSLLAPYERVMVYKQASDFHGIWLDDNAIGAAIAKSFVDAGAAPAPSGEPDSSRKETPDLAKPGSKAQIGIITMYKSKKYIVSTSKKAVTTGDPISRHSVLKLTGESVTINGAEYNETDEGWWMKSSEGVKTNPASMPKELKDGEKWVDVNVRTQTLVAYEGDKPVFATAVSTGLEDKSDKEKDHHTPTGTWRIREKHIAATMDGDVASDGPYSIEDVPWIMYFNGSYALHGAFWHNQFGRTKSHGCVNLAPQDAKALFAWTEPQMPEGWHGVWSTNEKKGTLIQVHE